jgi:hypothetical protein
VGTAASVGAASVLGAVGVEVDASGDNAVESDGASGSTVEVSGSTVEVSGRLGSCAKLAAGVINSRRSTPSAAHHAARIAPLGPRALTSKKPPARPL